MHMRVRDNTQSLCCVSDEISRTEVIFLLSLGVHMRLVRTSKEWIKWAANIILILMCEVSNMINYYY